MPSSSWHITFGDYELSVDRRALTITLTETKTGTIWGTDISLGWLELQDRETGTISRHPFGSLRQLSVSEKAGPQGKRILWGLDANGVPLDLYLICAQREVQLVVEASRDSKTHRVHGFGLVPGLCHVPDDGVSYLVFPQGEGAFLRADLMALDQSQLDLRVWRDLTMPFVGAVKPIEQSALALITDSAYSSFYITLEIGVGVTTSPHFERDPERRRLDLRVVPLPQGDHIAIARTYREKLISDNNHVPLRRKIRESPAVADLPGALLVTQDPDAWVRLIHDDIIGYQQPSWPSAVYLADLLDLNDDSTSSRWDAMESYLATFAKAREEVSIVGCRGASDWIYSAVDFRLLGYKSQVMSGTLPLDAVVYHDCVVPAVYAHPINILRGIINLAVPLSHTSVVAGNFLTPLLTVLCSLNHVTFATFLTHHRFLTPDYLVEEAIYSDKTRIVINQSPTDAFESDDLTLPPLGFYVRHRQVEAHDALRIGDQTFPTRKYRLARAGDGKPLETSDNVLRQEWDVPFNPTETENGQNPLS